MKLEEYVPGMIINNGSPIDWLYIFHIDSRVVTYYFSYDEGICRRTRPKYAFLRNADKIITDIFI